MQPTQLSGVTLGCCCCQKSDCKIKLKCRFDGHVLGHKGKQKQRIQSQCIYCQGSIDRESGQHREMVGEEALTHQQMCQTTMFILQLMFTRNKVLEIGFYAPRARTTVTVGFLQTVAVDIKFKQVQPCPSHHWSCQTLTNIGSQQVISGKATLERKKSSILYIHR